MQESLSDKLRELKSLLDEGLLTQEEFNDQKAKLLDGKGDSTAQAPLHAPSSSSAVAESNAAERQKLEKQLSALGGYGCLDIEPLVVNSILAFFLPILWIPVAVWIIATFVAHAKRSEARGALKAQSIEVARMSFSAAKTWYGIRIAASLALWGTGVYGVYLLLKGAAFLAGK